MAAVNVVAPVTPSVPTIVALAFNVVFPVTPSVPPTEALPLVDNVDKLAEVNTDILAYSGGNPDAIKANVHLGTIDSLTKNLTELQDQIDSKKNSDMISFHIYSFISKRVDLFKIDYAGNVLTINFKKSGRMDGKNIDFCYSKYSTSQVIDILTAFNATLRYLDTFCGNFGQPVKNRTSGTRHRRFRSRLASRLPSVPIRRSRWRPAS